MTATVINFDVTDDKQTFAEPALTYDVLREMSEHITSSSGACSTPEPLPAKPEFYRFTNPGDELTQQMLPITESGRLLKQYIESEGFGAHHIEIYDKWINNTAYVNIYSRELRFPDGRVVTFENLRILPPRYTRDGREVDLTPQMAREQEVTYGSDWHVDLVLRQGDRNGDELDRRRNVCIGTIPVMLKSQYCILRNKSPRELTLLGEDPDDPGGYFIVDGVEKVVLLQEQLATNKIFLMQINSKGTVVARMTANTIRGTALIELALDKKTNSIIKIRFPSMRTKQGENYKSVNVLRIFRILGISTPEEMQSRLALFMKPEHVEGSMLKLTRNILNLLMFPNDIDTMAAKMEKGNLSPEDKAAEVRRVFDTDLFPHLNELPGPDGETEEERENRIITAKVYLLEIMVARFLEYQAGYRKLDDRDSWSNKRTEGAGRMMEQLLRTAWRRALGGVQALIELNQVRELGGVYENIRYSTITDTFHDSFITNKWGVKGTNMKENVSQTLIRDSVVATFAHINTIDVGISRTDRQTQIREIQDSQFGLVDPITTPEGENSGLLKNLGVTAKVTPERNDRAIIRLLVGDPDRGWPQRAFYDPEARFQYPDKIMVNGKFLGWCNGPEVKDLLVTLRRNNDTVPLDMSVIYEDGWVYVDISPSRLVYPLLIVNPDQTLAIDTLGLRNAPNHQLVSCGAMEYMSAWEQEYIKLAPSEEWIRRRLEQIEDANRTYRQAQNYLERIDAGETVITTVNGEEQAMTRKEAQKRVDDALEHQQKMTNSRPYTHCMIDPSCMLGIAAALIIWANHNQAPRNTYQAAMSKQALGIYHANHANRFDGKIKVLSFPERPMVETDLYSSIGLDDRGPGENALVAFMALPDTEEDAFVFKKEFIERGGHRIVKYLTYKAVIRHTGGVIETLGMPAIRPGENPDRYRYIQNTGVRTPENGLPLLGAPLRQGDCVIGIIQVVAQTNEIRNNSTLDRKSVV